MFRAAMNRGHCVRDLRRNCSSLLCFYWLVSDNSVAGLFILGCVADNSVPGTPLTKVLLQCRKYITTLNAGLAGMLCLSSTYFAQQLHACLYLFTYGPARRICSLQRNPLGYTLW